MIWENNFAEFEESSFGCLKAHLVDGASFGKKKKKGCLLGKLSSLFCFLVLWKKDNPVICLGIQVKVEFC